jgi:hypothetical protein
MLVVHDTPLVAEDLRETLLGAGAGDVELALSLPAEESPERFDACFLSVSSEGLRDATLLDRAARLAAHVVLIVGFLQQRPELPPCFSVLSEPFRHEDVLAVLLALNGGRGGAA